MSATYPGHRAVDVPLRDGSTVRIRPVRPSDMDGVRDLFGRLSTDSARMRFHGIRHPSDEEIKGYVEVDYVEDLGLVAETEDVSGRVRIQALASYASTGDHVAEIAIVVDDSMHGKGIGSVLIEHLSEAAVEADITTFQAEILSSNTAMFEVIRDLELPLRTTASDGVTHVEFPTSPTPDALEAFERREAVAAVAAIRGFLHPSSVAVVGASRKRGSIGFEIFRNLLNMGFEGPVYPVNPTADVIGSVKAYPSVIECPDPVDLAVIVVPAAAVLDVAKQCAEKGVRSLLIISAGFSEAGEAGKKRQVELMRLVRATGMRVIGPNCMGIMNLSPEVRLNATFSPVTPAHGNLAFSSQSGALGIAVMDRALSLGLGLSSFVSVGNKADISGNDLIQYWEGDDDTDVILLYLESFGNPRKFARIARRTAKHKPIVAVKSGRSRAGARAAASHTASVASGDVAVDALFKQTGVIRTETLEELFDVAALLAYQPLPGGGKVGILTNAGGLGILCADACESSGLEVPPLSEKTAATLREFLPAEASVGNPVDMIASASAEQYARSLRVLSEDPEIDALIVIFIPPLVTRAEDVAMAISEVTKRIEDKTVLACFLGVQGVHDLLSEGDRVIPSYSFPESAARALGRVASYARWRQRPDGSVPGYKDVDRGAALATVTRSLAKGEGWLDPTSVSDLLTHYGVSTARSRLVGSIHEVEEAAGELGGHVAVKVHSSTIVHKTDVGGVVLGLRGAGEAGDAARRITSNLDQAGRLDELEGFLVQEMIAGEGTEMFVGMTQDPSFGPLLACGAGGTLVELMKDISVRITPLTDIDAVEMLGSLKMYPLFKGYRGQPALDASAVVELLLRLSVLVGDLPHIAEMDLNPVIVFPEGKGYAVADARVRLAYPKPVVPRGART
ncbi:MAG: GNAT family N-acetyltransferase [Actinomycetota bacterium]